MYEKALAKARKQRHAEPDAVAAVVDPVDVPTNIAEKPSSVEIPDIEVTPVVASCTPTQKRPRRRRVRSVLLIPFRFAAMLILVFGLVGCGIVLATVKGGDLSVRAYVAAVQDLPAMIVSKPCNFDHENGTGCKS